MEPKLKLSVLINTFNEERNISACLESVIWADEIIIVDMYSDDKTIEIARKYTDKIFFFERCGYADPAREFARQHATRDWIFVIDADELVTPALKKRITAIVSNPDSPDIVYIPRKNYMFGSPVMGSGFHPFEDSIPRLFKKEALKFGNAVHDFMHEQPDSKKEYIKNIDEHLIHLAYTDIDTYIEKFNRYTTIEAKNIFEKKKKGLTLFDIFFKNGIKDGIRGLYLNIMSNMIYHLTTYYKFKVMKQYNTTDAKEAIIKDYQGIISRNNSGFSDYL